MFKYISIFSQEPIVFDDYTQTKSVTSPALMYLDFNETLPEGEHYYKHIGRVGSFVPVMPNTGGGLLLRYKDDKYTSVVGTKGHRWKESELVKNLGQEDQIDLLYFNTLVNDAIHTIEKFGPIDDLIDYDLRRTYEKEEEELIGFDDVPQIDAVATAMII